MLYISDTLCIDDAELEFTAIRASGPGGQHVNKVSSAIQLRFDASRSSLPEDCLQRLLALKDRRISRDGMITIKAQRFRSQEKNRLDALQRLRDLLAQAAVKPRPRRATKPGKTARAKRVDTKTRRGQLKRGRAKIRDDQG